MENHPIPQDVTGFQFKLIGSMTLKQFGYVGTGVILAVIMYYAPISIFIKLLTIPLFSLSGVALAFLPIDGRPVDLMARFFITAVIKPNQYIYQKTGGVLSFTELTLHPVVMPSATSPLIMAKKEPEQRKKSEQLYSYLYDSSDTVVNPLDQRENQILSSLFTQPAVPVQTVSFAPPPPIPAAQPDEPSVLVPKSFTETQTPAAAPLQSQPINPPNYNPFPQPTTNVSVSTQTPETPPAVTPAATAEVPAQTIVPTPQMTVQPLPPSTFVQVVPTNQDIQPAAKKFTGMDFPNLVTGIVKDSRGNVLAGILVEVKNKDGDSVRAFKTNALGQFASATQLANGVYTIVFEDPKKQHKFDTVQVEANGSILEPLIVISIDAREELRRSLFG